MYMRVETKKLLSSFGIFLWDASSIDPDSTPLSAMGRYSLKNDPLKLSYILVSQAINDWG